MLPKSIQEDRKDEELMDMENHSSSNDREHAYNYSVSKDIAELNEVVDGLHLQGDGGFPHPLDNANANASQETNPNKSNSNVEGENKNRNTVVYHSYCCFFWLMILNDFQRGSLAS